MAIAEPKHRTHLIHEYHINKYSLYAAVSIGLSSEMILNQLRLLCKTKLPVSLVSMVREYASRYGKLRLVLHKTGYAVESNERELLETLLADHTINSSLLEDNPGEDPIRHHTINDSALAIPSFPVEFDPAAILEQNDESVFLESHVSFTQSFYSFPISLLHAEQVRRRCIELDYPLLEEYDFRKDTRVNNIRIELKPTTTLRSYQEKCLAKIFSNGRARSGIIALPCGAGKTLVGITAAATIKKPIVVLYVQKRYLGSSHH